MYVFKPIWNFQAKKISCGINNNPPFFLGRSLAAYEPDPTDIIDELGDVIIDRFIVIFGDGWRNLK